MKFIKNLFKYTILSLSLLALFSCGGNDETPTESPTTTVETFSYFTSNNEVTIAGLNDQTLTDVVIPEYINGMMVVAIKENAFQDNKNIKTLTLSGTVEVISHHAFAGCENLESVTFADTSVLNPNITGTQSQLKYIRDNAFENCTSLTEVIIPYSVKQIDSYAFAGCTNIKKILIPSTVEYIMQYAFNGLIALEEVQYYGFEYDYNNMYKDNNAFANCNSTYAVTYNFKTTE